MRLGSTDLQNTLSFLTSIKNCNDVDEINRLILQTTNSFGIESFIGGFIPRLAQRPVDQSKNVLVGHWPAEWAKIYFAHNMLYRDPTIRHILLGKQTFVWSDLTTADTLSVNERRVMDKAREFGLRAGCTVPMLSLDGEYVGFSFAGRHVDASPEAKGVMTLLSSFAFARALEIRRSASEHAVRLTRREHEVAQWIAAGKTDWETSIILGVSEKAIAKHVNNIRIKTGAVNRTHAIAECIRCGLIT